MRHATFGSILVALLALVSGCAPDLFNPDGGSLIDAIAGVADTGDGSDDAQTAASPATDNDGSFSITGSVGAQGDYRLFDLGPATHSQRWTVTATGGLFNPTTFLVVLLDKDHNLLQRQIITGSTPLGHIIRSSTDAAYLGVTAAFGRTGGSFNFQVDHRGGASVPAPHPQVVWLNFGGASDVSVHRRNGLSFPAFDAEQAGTAYEGATTEMKAAIVAAMREDYVDYNLVICTSDDPPPEGPYATLHFGDYDDRLLGLADSVDQYNQDSWESAIVYVESFADYAVMNLSADEMGQMIGNVASHELGHLLGLFHTQVPDNIMDTTGTAWDLAGNQSFTRGRMERTVFPVGYENSPDRLAEVLGPNPDKPDSVTKPLLTAKMLRKAGIRAMVREELHCRCGTCLNLDE